MGTPSEDLAEGYSGLLRLRGKTLEDGLTEREFVEDALRQDVGSKNRYILENFWNYDLSLFDGIE